MDYASPAAQFAFDLNKSPLFILDKNNYINIMGVKQLNTLVNVSLLDIFMSANHVIEPHYHQDSTELVYCISGSATVTILNPYTKQLQSYTIAPGQVSNVPQGWWHYIVAHADGTHLLAIFNAPMPQVILGSDLLKFTPAQILAQTYCIDEQTWKAAVAPVQSPTLIGPPTNCQQGKASYPYQYPFQYYWGMQQG